MDAGEGLRLIRVLYNIPQKEVAHLLNKSNSYICKIEKGIIKPNNDILREYAEIYGLSLLSLAKFLAAVIKVDIYHNLVYLEELFEENTYYRITESGRKYLENLNKENETKNE